MTTQYQSNCKQAQRAYMNTIDDRPREYIVACIPRFFRPRTISECKLSRRRRRSLEIANKSHENTQSYIVTANESHPLNSIPHAVDRPPINPFEGRRTKPLIQLMKSVASLVHSHSFHPIDQPDVHLMAYLLVLNLLRIPVPLTTPVRSRCLSGLPQYVVDGPIPRKPYSS